jgi:hypothetical protein
MPTNIFLKSQLQKIIFKTESTVSRYMQQTKHMDILELGTNIVQISDVSMHTGLFLLTMDTVS